MPSCFQCTKEIPAGDAISVEVQGELFDFCPHCAPGHHAPEAARPEEPRRSVGPIPELADEDKTPLVSTAEFTPNVARAVAFGCIGAGIWVAILLGIVITYHVYYYWLTIALGFFTALGVVKGSGGHHGLPMQFLSMGLILAALFLGDIMIFMVNPRLLGNIFEIAFWFFALIAGYVTASEYSHF